MSNGKQRLDISDIRQPRWAQYLFDNPASAWIWLLLRVWLGWSWLEAGWHKVTDPAWMSTGEAIKNFWVRAAAVPAAPARPPITYDWYRGFLQFLLDSGAHPWFGPLIALGEFLVGLGLILGVLVGFASFFGAFMNMNFMLAGTASTNPVLFLVAMLLVLAWKVAGYYGLDRWILPALGTPWMAGWLVGGARQRAPAASSSA
ncbi:MAG: DoxX family membrane protein [Chloroflexi bacterium]|nr:DoxX family membrane protein [Chloroflexota bacterium]